MKQSSITVVIPALNEEANLRGAVRSAIEACEQHFKDYEILIFNDGSRDRTGEIAEQLARKNPKIRAIHHSTPKNLGGCYKAGIALATKEFLLLVPGDNECRKKLITQVLACAGEADIIIPYPTNSGVRPMSRQVISQAFTALLNHLSGRTLRYYNGTVLHKTALVRRYPLKTDSFAYQAELLVRMLKGGATFHELGVEIHHRTTGRSKAFRVKNVIETARCVGQLASENFRPSPA